MHHTSRTAYTTSSRHLIRLALALLLALVLLLVVFFVCAKAGQVWAYPSIPAPELPPSQKTPATPPSVPASTSARGASEEPALPDGASQAWWASVQAKIDREMHFIAPAAETVGAAGDAAGAGYAAINPGANLAIHFPPDGGFWVTAAPARPGPEDANGTDDIGDATAPDWRWGVRPLRIQIGEMVHDLGQPQPAVVTENRLAQDYTSTGFALTEWFVNDEAGLRQNFTLDSWPAGPADQPLRLELAGSGSLRGEVDGDGQGLTLRNASGDALLVYRDLKISDANSQSVPGHFVLDTDRAHPGALAIVVDDAGAAYPLTIDPLTGSAASPAFTANGEGVDNYFGQSVAGAGDVNGDGYADVIVGAYGNSNFTGRVYLFPGGPSGLSASPAFTATGEGTGDYFGASVAGAGDVNGDGYADVIVGAYGYDSSTGRAYLFSGGPSGLSASPAFTATGEGANNTFGSSVAGAGDVNGDGYADVIVGAFGYNSYTGRAYAFHGGGDGLRASPTFTATGEGTNNYFGASVAGAGDVNGDGYADVIVGAEGYSSYTGRAYLFPGGPSGLSASPAFTAIGEATFDSFGWSVAGAGDVNGDGYADVIVGAIGYGNYTGRTYLFHGGPSGLSASPAFTATGEGTYNNFGASVAGAGDVNGDGYADVIVGAYGYDNSNTGRAYLFPGGPSGLSASPAFTATGEGTYN
ncbi:MAG: FG-GAP repeat protein, partial [Caldilineaceae bacterium]|nr:FG-GAP repeat protein [Caldilineaceae bacterium]